MTTTSLGIPKYAQTDNADIASKLNAIADQTNTLLVGRSTPIAVKRVVRSDGAKFTVATGSTDRLVTAFNTATHSSGLVTYAGGIMTIGTGGAGLFLLSVHTTWPASSAAAGSVYSRTVGYYLNGSRIAGLTGCDQRTVVANEGSKQMNTTSVIPLADGDQIQPFLSQSGPSSEDVLVLDFAIVRLF